ncbi:MAG TPA: hypothetical protein VFH04_00675 [Nitrososphaeraceae archaeon]|nr:hypothetical protein [Nitrososphaeraceae archaeon]
MMLEAYIHTPSIIFVERVQDEYIKSSNGTEGCDEPPNGFPKLLVIQLSRKTKLSLTNFRAIDGST